MSKVLGRVGQHPQGAAGGTCVGSRCGTREGQVHLRAWFFSSRLLFSICFKRLWPLTAWVASTAHPGQLGSPPCPEITCVGSHAESGSKCTSSEAVVGWFGAESPLYHCPVSYNGLVASEGKVPLVSRWLRERCPPQEEAGPAGAPLGTKPGAGLQPCALLVWRSGTGWWLWQHGMPVSVVCCHVPEPASAHPCGSLIAAVRFPCW